jgi:hypothetical protein
VLNHEPNRRILLHFVSSLYQKIYSTPAIALGIDDIR